MSNHDKVLQAIINAAPDVRPGNVDPAKVRALLTISDDDFAQSLSELEQEGYLTRIFGSNLLTDISFSTKLPTK